MAFVYSTREDLQFIFDVAGPYLAPSVADYLWLAWHAVQARGEFERLVDAIEGRDYDDELDRAGLSGPELDFKLSGLEAAREAGRETQAPRWLKWIDVILGSLLAATGVGESIKEIKEGVEAELEPHDEPRA